MHSHHLYLIHTVMDHAGQRQCCGHRHDEHRSLQEMYSTLHYFTKQNANLTIDVHSSTKSATKSFLLSTIEFGSKRITS